MSGKPARALREDEVSETRRTVARRQAMPPLAAQSTTEEVGSTTGDEEGFPPNAGRRRPFDLKRWVRECETLLIVKTLTATEGNQRQAAHVLGMLRSTLHEKINQLGIREQALRQRHRTDRNRHEANPEPAAHEFRYSGRLPPGGTLEVRGAPRSIEVEMTLATECEVVGLCRSGRIAADHIAVQHKDGDVIVWVQPEKGAPLRAEEPGALAGLLDLTVRIPFGVRFVSRCASGYGASGAVPGLVQRPRGDSLATPEEFHR
jgi:hypothetical protein